MNNVKKYAVDIRLRNDVYRYATNTLTRYIEDEAGDQIPLAYLPYIVEVNAPETKVELERSASITSFSLTIWDAYQDVSNTFEKFEFEAAEITFYYLDEDDNEISSLIGYMTDTRFDAGSLSFTIRVDEDRSAKDYMRVFSTDTYQYHEVLPPYRVEFQTTFEVKENTQWQVFKPALRSTFVPEQPQQYIDNVGQRIYFNQPSNIGSLRGGSEGQVIMLPEDFFNTYRDYVVQDVFFIRMFEVDTAHTYQFDYDGTTISYTPLVTDTAIEILDGLRADFVLNGYNARVLEDVVRLYVVGDPALLDTTGVGNSFEEGKLEVFFDPDTPGSTRQLAPLGVEMFSNSNGLDYEIMWLGDSQKDNLELVAYAYALKGQIYVPGVGVVTLSAALSERWFLSGIPSVSTPDPASLGLATIQSTIDATVTSLADWADRYGITNRHNWGERINPINNKDRVWVSANGLQVLSVDDPNLGVGFIHLGRTIYVPSYGKEIFIFHRYQIESIEENIYDDNRNDGTIHPQVLELSIHNKPLDSSHDYALNDISVRYDVPLSMIPDDLTKIGDHKSVVYEILFYMNELDNDTYDLLLNQDLQRYRLQDRYKGLRVDMIEDFKEYVQVIGRNFFQDGNDLDVQENIKQNKNLLNNATGLFAVCTESDVVVEDGRLYERLRFFRTSDVDERLFTVEDPDDNDLIAQAQNDASQVQLNGSHSDYYFNNLIYKPEFKNARQQQDYADEYDTTVQEYFGSKRFRIIHNPVPENSSDLGKYFPICYGYQKRVPLLQVISKKTFASDSSTAGDDYYVYASHPCDVPDFSSILIEYFDDQAKNPNDRDNLTVLTTLNLVESPFPNVLPDHYEPNPDTSTEDNVIIRYAGSLYKPYHDIENKTGLDKYKNYGVRLQGSLWKPRVGTLDRRYPIRNGLGTTRLYATFNGYLDQDGSITGNQGNVVEHPLDVIKHFVLQYGVFPYNETILDQGNIEKIKGMTRRYRTSVRLESPISSKNFIDAICRQCGILNYYDGGKVKFAVFDESFVDYNKPIAEGLNLLMGTKRESQGYKDIYDEIVFEYDYNYVLQSYNSKIILNSKNNSFCATNSRSLGGKKTFSVQANHINDPYTANEVANLYARMLCRKTNVYSISVKDIGFRFERATFVPMTYSKLGLDNTPVFIKSVKELPDKIELEVIEFV